MKYIVDSMCVEEIRFVLQCVTVSETVSCTFCVVFPDLCHLDTSINAWEDVKRILLAAKLFYSKSTDFYTVIVPKDFIDLTQVIRRSRIAVPEVC